MRNRFASALSQHPIPAHAVGEAAGEIIESLGGEEPDLLICFASPDFVGAMDDIVHALGRVLEPRVLIGMNAVAVVGGAREVEDTPGLSLFAASVPEARLTAAALGLERAPDGNTVTGWPDLGGAPTTLLLLTDPFTFPTDAFLRRLDDDLPGLQVIGGAASAARGPGGNRLVLDQQDVHRGTGREPSRVATSGAVGVFLEGVDVRAVVSQGCRPVGNPFVVTRARGNHLEELGGVAAMTRLQECAEEATEDDRALMQAGLHLGVVVDEHKVEFDRNDFLVRAVLGADRQTGSIAVDDDVSVGQTVQFHVRDAAGADEDLRELLADVEASAALLFTCEARGRQMFGVADHDARIVDEMLGPLPLAGAFCAGEIGPIGGRNALHTFTASLALF
jgi:small ligand-binding sensory domain FIST